MTHFEFLLQLPTEDWKLGQYGEGSICWLGHQFEKHSPECHEHCDCCHEAICSEHGPAWHGFRTACRGSNDESYWGWLCPPCFEHFRALLHVHLVEGLDSSGAPCDTELGRQIELYWPDNMECVAALKPRN